jgi:hypothetical protein
MNTKPSFLIAGWLLCGASLPAADAPAKKPNMLLLVADDLGWADVGWHGGKFRTPVLDRLVREGVELVQEMPKDAGDSAVDQADK